MTAVEWFAGEIKGGQLITNQKFKELLEQAKEMENQQIENAFEQGVKWQQEQDKKCYHPMTERKHTSDVHFECTICGYNNY